MTTRLQPTALLPEVYRNGTVEGNSAFWRDVALRGHIPGPLVRPTTSTQPSRASVLSQQQKAKNITQPEEIVLDLQPRSESEACQSIGRLMRVDVRQTSELQRAPEVECAYHPDKASVKQAVEQLKRFDSLNPYQIDEQMQRVISQVQRDIYNLRELCREEKDGLRTDAGRELLDRVQACRQIRLMDMNDGFLDLDDFDAPGYEAHTPQQWMEHHARQFVFPDGREVDGVPGYSRYLYKDRVALEPVVVTGYDVDDRVWYVYWVS